MYVDPNPYGSSQSLDISTFILILFIFFSFAIPIHIYHPSLKKDPRRDPLLGINNGGSSDHIILGLHGIYTLLIHHKLHNCYHRIHTEGGAITTLHVEFKQIESRNFVIPISYNISGF